MFHQHQSFDAGETLTDTFTYTISDGTATATANIVITLLGDDGNTNNDTHVILCGWCIVSIAIIT